MVDKSQDNTDEKAFPLSHNMSPRILPKGHRRAQANRVKKVRGMDCYQCTLSSIIAAAAELGYQVQPVDSLQSTAMNIFGIKPQNISQKIVIKDVELR